MRWTFGVEPLPQTIEAAQLLRRVTELVLALDDEEPAVAQLVADLETAETRLAERVPSDPAPRIGDAVDDPNRRVYLDHARDVGAFNPSFPEYEIVVDPVDGDRATGTVTFSPVFEGPPGLVHGGFLGVLFDCVMQHHNCDVGVAGKTASLGLRYRRPTPLGTPLRFNLHRTVADRWITSTGELVGPNGKVLCEAQMRAIVGDRAALPAVSPRRRMW